MASTRSDELLQLRNIGPAMRRDFALLGIDSIARLARCNADVLYLALQQKTGRRHDPCVWDTLSAAIHQAQTGEALPWWHFTHERKAREIAGTFPASLIDSPRHAGRGSRKPRKRA
jgi:hypothetical protein